MDTKTFSQAAEVWKQQNLKLLQKHKGQWIAYNGDDGIIAAGKLVSTVIQEARKTDKRFMLKYLHPYTYAGLRRLLSIRFRPLRMEMWEPTLAVPITYKNKSIDLEMLVD